MNCRAGFKPASRVGRKPLYCPDCRRAVDRVKARDRMRAIRAGESRYPACCRESGKRVCDQHQDMNRWLREQAIGEHARQELYGILDTLGVGFHWHS
jgi:hypothetical protein